MERNDEGRRDRDRYEGRAPERSARRWEHGEIGESRTGAPERSGYAGWEREPQDYGPGRPEDWGDLRRGRDRYERGWAESRGREPYGRGAWGGPQEEPWAHNTAQWGERGYERDQRNDDERAYSTRPTRNYEDRPWRGQEESRGAQYGYRVGPEPREARSETERWTGEPGRSPGQRLLGRGRPPRDYRRADDRIRDEIIEVIVRESDVDATDVDVQVLAGEVTLAGTVEDRASKRELEDIAERVFGVSDVHNTVRVRKSAWRELGDRLFGSNEGEKTPQTQGSKTPKS